MPARTAPALSPLVVVALTLFLDFTGLTLVIPLLPYWAEHLGASPLIIGAVAASYALAQLVCTPLVGTLSDRYGRKPVILASLVIEAAAFALTAVATSLPLLFVARVLGGIGASNVGSAQAVAADVTTPERRAAAMGGIGAAIGAGHIVGPAVGGLLFAVSAATPFWVATGVAVLNAALVWAFLPETHSATTRTAPMSLLRTWQTALRRPGVLRLALVSLLFTLAMLAMETVFALYTQRTFGWTPESNGWLFAYLGLIVAATQLGVVGPLARRVSAGRLLVAGLALLAAGLALLPLAAPPVSLLVALGLFAFGAGVASPMVSTLLSLAAPADAQGGTLGLAQAITGAGRLAGSLLAGGLFAAGAGLPFLAGAALCAVGLLLALPLAGKSNTGTTRRMDTKGAMR